MRETFLFAFFLPLPAVHHRDARADQHQRYRVAQKRRVAVSVHQQERKNHAEIGCKNV